jgi:hypothetical protein
LSLLQALLGFVALYPPTFCWFIAKSETQQLAKWWERLSSRDINGTLSFEIAAESRSQCAREGTMSER